MSVRCAGLPPLEARREPWMDALLATPEVLAGWIAAYGSPVNVIHTDPLVRNARSLRDAARAHGVDLRVFVARKANKALAVVDAARAAGLGVDVASDRELEQVLARGVPAADVIVTAAVTPDPLLARCARHGVTVALDNADALAAHAALAGALGVRAPVAVRIAPAPPGVATPTRFGLAPAAWRRVLPPPGGPLTVTGVHFHLDGYDPGHRRAAVAEALELTDGLRADGHPVAFLDIGGGIPMRYVDDAGQWQRFRDAHAAGLVGEGPAVTYGDHPLGRRVDGGRVSGPIAAYPAHQSPVGAGWLDRVLGDGVAASIARRGLELRCEPGRFVMDGCGMTVARVEFRKQRRDGVWLVGLAMNRTQCRSAAEDFLVDPLLVRPVGAGAATAPVTAALVGAYCIERELLTWRWLHFPDGVARGDLVVFPNTAGYLMHIVESASHQMPLARNLVTTGDGTATPDDIDAVAGSRPGRMPQNRRNLDLRPVVGRQGLL